MIVSWAGGPSSASQVGGAQLALPSGPSSISASQAVATAAAASDDDDDDAPMGSEVAKSAEEEAARYDDEGDLWETMPRPNPYPSSRSTHAVERKGADSSASMELMD